MFKIILKAGNMEDSKDNQQSYDYSAFFNQPKWYRYNLILLFEFSKLLI